MKSLVKIIGFALLVALVACSDDENGDPASNEVGMSPTSFIPAQLTIKAGETVVWKNTDSILHTVTSNDGLFNENVQPGATFSYTFTAAGTYNYVCTLHPGMNGTIIVE
jgi:plastocyanin